jgi:hypothetical protein
MPDSTARRRALLVAAAAILSAVITAKPIRVFFSHSEEDAPLRVHIHLALSATASPSEAPETYWRRVRDELQAYFNVNLRDLQPLVDIAYPTLVNLG